MTPLDMDRIVTVAHASAVMMLDGLFAGADPDRRAEVLQRIIPYFEGCALAAHDALYDRKRAFPAPSPSPN